MQKRFIQRSLGEVGLSPIVIVIIIALVLGGFLIYQKQSSTNQEVLKQVETSIPVPDETNNWKTYEDEHFGNRI